MHDSGAQTLSFPHMIQFILCSINQQAAVERFYLWPLAGTMAVGTIGWVATVLLLMKVRNNAPCPGTHTTQTLSASENWRRDIVMYLRLLVYELVALIPASVLVIPYEVRPSMVCCGAHTDDTCTCRATDTHKHTQDRHRHTATHSTHRHTQTTHMGSSLMVCSGSAKGYQPRSC